MPAPGATTASVTQLRRHASKPGSRARADDSQFLRRTVQAAFLLLNLWIGARFYVFVRYYETGGQGMWVPRPPGVEGWLPIAVLMNLKASVLTGRLPDAHAAGLFLLVAFLTISVLLRKSFCSWLCPIGTLSEWLWEGGEAALGRTARVPRWLDVPLRGLKYVLLGLFLYAVASMDVAGIRAFLDSPYGTIADVKMLNFFRHVGTTGATVVGVLLFLSIVVKNPWCRYLCPYGARLGLVALVSPSRIRRTPDACLDCGKCTKACPSALPVDRLLSVRSAECTSCLSCVAACPAAGALHFGFSRRRAIPAWAAVAAIVAIFAAFVGSARLTGHWHTNVPDEVYFQLIPRAPQFNHP